MTTYKCKTCGKTWSMGPTRDHCETEDCHICLRHRLGMLTREDAGFDWEEWPGGWPEVLAAYETALDLCAKLHDAMHIIAYGEDPDYPGSMMTASQLRKIASDSLIYKFNNKA